MSDVSVRAVSLISLRVAELRSPINATEEWAVYACIRIHVGSAETHRCWVCWNGPWPTKAAAKAALRDDARQYIESAMLTNVQMAPHLYLNRDKPTLAGIKDWAAGQSHRLAPKASLGSPRRADHERTRKHLRAKRQSAGFTDGARQYLAGVGIPLED
jgi:hypothetical protein